MEYVIIRVSDALPFFPPPKNPVNPKKIIVIGAGLGGISAAISLRQLGYDVELFEKNDKVGGKLNVLLKDGYTFDLGPSILTLPHLFERLFERSGKRMSDYFTIVPVRPHWRNFFEDGKVIDLHPDPVVMAGEARKAGEPPENVEKFLAYSGRLYDLTNNGYFERGLDSTRDFLRHYGAFRFFGFDLFRTMDQAVRAHFLTPHFRDIFNFFIKYVGSSATRAPAFMNSLPTIQFRHDLWYVDGGMYNIAIGLEKLMREIGIGIHLEQDVSEIRRSGDRVTGIVANGVLHEADIIVSNMEVVPVYRDLLGKDASFLRRKEKILEPACSGLILELGLDRKYDQLAHHNFFFSRDQSKHFKTVFEDYRLPEDPTIYLVAAARTDPTVAPPGCDCLKILPHIPHLRDDRPLEQSDWLAMRERVLDKLERMGLRDLRRHIVCEHLWTPRDIEERYRSNRGSIYGVAADRWKNLAFKAAKQCPEHPNLFFTGGSVNPGGGMPMVILCGQNVARKVAEWSPPR